MRHRSTNLALSHLKHLPVNKLKRARSFILPGERVKFKVQYEILKDLGCDYAQRYLFGKPLAVLKSGSVARK